jgi:hypothetical protein
MANAVMGTYDTAVVIITTPAQQIDNGTVDQKNICTYLAATIMMRKTTRYTTRARTLIMGNMKISVLLGSSQS